MRQLPLQGSAWHHRWMLKATLCGRKCAANKPEPGWAYGRQYIMTSQRYIGTCKQVLPDSWTPQTVIVGGWNSTQHHCLREWVCGFLVHQLLIACTIWKKYRSINPMNCIGRIRLSVSTVNRTYELSGITHLTPFCNYGKHSSGPSTYGPWDRTFSKFFSWKSVLTDCSYRTPWNEICKYGRVSRGYLPRVCRYGFAVLTDSRIQPILKF